MVGRVEVGAVVGRDAGTLDRPSRTVGELGTDVFRAAGQRYQSMLRWMRGVGAVGSVGVEGTGSLSWAKCDGHVHVLVRPVIGPVSGLLGAGGCHRPFV